MSPPKPKVFILLIRMAKGGTAVGFSFLVIAQKPGGRPSAHQEGRAQVSGLTGHGFLSSYLTVPLTFQNQGQSFLSLNQASKEQHERVLRPQQSCLTVLSADKGFKKMGWALTVSPS